MHSPILLPLLALALWTFVMETWLYATRIPAMTRGKIAYDPRRPAAEFHGQLPAHVRWKADNFNNLMEQPTVFYAVAIVLALLGAGSGLNLALAWAYVGLRVVHSLIQATVNIVLPRFLVFVASSVVLLAMTLRAATLAL